MPPKSPSTAQSRLSALSSTLSPTSNTSPSTSPSPSQPNQKEYHFPPFNSLPRIPNQPQGSLWTFFDTPHQKDQLGTLNTLQPLLASQSILTGKHIQLDWCLSQNVSHPGFGRKTFHHKIIDKLPLTNGKHAGFDDEVSFNTQSGSQWDGLKHFAHQKTKMYYNGLSHAEALSHPERNGIQAWCEAGGIVGRGVLVDWVRWHESSHGKAPSPISRHEIPIEQVEECLKWQGTETRQGDILLIRSGFVRWHDEASAEERKKGTQEQSKSIGLQANEKTVRWLYDRHFAAVAGDTVAFEAWPPPWKSGWVLHEWLLVQWGTPIGEMWNLEQLSEMCLKEQRWSFFLTSAPLHVKGGVGSPPGAIAIF